MVDKLDDILRRFESIEAQLQDPSVIGSPSEMQRLGKARAELEEIVEVIRAYRRAQAELAEAKEMLGDPEMKEMARDEVARLEPALEDLQTQIKMLLVPKDPMDDKPVIIEIRPAAGGDEAGIFANELFRMYARYAERRRWKFDVIEHEETSIGSVGKVVFSIDAKGAYSQLKFESGVHRVQRVPATESQGRIHTSTVTVAVLPEAEEVDIEVRTEDLEIDTFRASSAGGQHVQKNETAIRIVHRPTGIVVSCQDERSQQQNKLRAMQVLRAKLYQVEQEKAEKERGAMRKSQIGSGDRSEKIRTYNFPQSRITDHRIGFSSHNMITFMDGDIQAMIDALRQEESQRKLAAAQQGETVGV